MKKENPTAQITAKRIRMALDERVMTQQMLSDLSDVSKSSISQYVHARNIPSADNARRMSAVLGVRPEWLMGFGDDDIEKNMDSSWWAIQEMWKMITTEQRETLVNTAIMFAKLNMEIDKK